MRLIIEDDSGRRVIVPVEREEITIGRHDSNHIRLNERNVSRRHCRLLRFGDALVVEDLQSSNGLRVNGAPIIGRRQVAPGDRIGVGDYSISVIGSAGGTTSSSDSEGALEATVETTQPRNLPEPHVEQARSPVVSTVAAPDSVPVIARTTPGPLAEVAPQPIPRFPIEAFRALQARGLVPKLPPVVAPAVVATPALVAEPAVVAAPAPVAEPAVIAELVAAPLPLATSSVAVEPSVVAERLPLAPQTDVRAPPALQPSFALPPVVPGAAVRPAPTTMPAVSREAARLVVLTTELAGTSVALPTTAAWIGRSAESDLVLDHRSIADRHCRVEPVGDGTFRIVRADPSLALSVNGAPGDDAILCPGDTLRIGAMLLRLVAGQPRGA